MTDKLQACETPMRDHVAAFWRLLAEGRVRILVDTHHPEGFGGTGHWTSSSFPDDVAKALLAARPPLPKGRTARVTEVVKSLRVASAQGTYPLPPVEQPGYMFAGRAVVVDSSILDSAAAEIERLRAELVWVSEQRWNEDADLDDICTMADRAIQFEAGAALNPKDSTDD